MSQKTPTVKLFQPVPSDSPAKAPTFIEISLSNRRSAQAFSLKQAENLANKLLRLVREARVRETLES